MYGSTFIYRYTLLNPNLDFSKLSISVNLHVCYTHLHIYMHVSKHMHEHIEATQQRLQYGNSLLMLLPAVRIQVPSFYCTSLKNS